MIEKKSNKGLIILVVLLILMVLGLGGYIVYDKFLTKEDVKEETKTKEPKKEEVTQPKWDLSAVPQTEDACTYNVTMDEVNNDVKETKKLCDGKLTKYIVNDVKVDGIEQNVQILSYDYLDNVNIESLNNLSGLYLDGKQVFKGLGPQSWVKLYIYDDFLFAHVDGGTSVTGYVNVLAFDKMGAEVYNLETALKQSNIVETISSEPNKVVTVNDIARNGVNVSDGSITFNSYMTQGFPCVNGYRGSTYKVTYDGTNFGKITNVGGWKFDNDSCVEAYN